MLIIGAILLFCALLWITINESDTWVRLLSKNKGNILISPLILRHSQKSNKAILLLHEFSGLPRSFEELANKLYAEGWDVFVPALPETVESKDDLFRITCGPLYPLWYETAKRSIEQLLREYEHVAVGGSSIGGSIALDISSRYPVKAVFTIAAPISLFGWHYFRPFSRNLMLFFSGWVGLFRPWWQTSSSSSSSLEKRYGIDGVIWARAIHTQKIALRRLRKRLSSIVSPCLIIHAQNDRTVNVSNAFFLLRHLAHTSRECHIFDMTWDKESRHHLLLNHSITSPAVQACILHFLKRTIP